MTDLILVNNKKILTDAKTVPSASLRFVSQVGNRKVEFEET